MGSLPHNLAQRSGTGSAYMREWIPGCCCERFLDKHAATDVLAGTWMFALFMAVCVVFGVVQLATDPSALNIWFLLSQIPFAAGFIMLARASYPDRINSSSLFDSQGVLDEMIAAGYNEAGQANVLSDKT